jgi:hypothetical protein
MSDEFFSQRLDRPPLAEVEVLASFPVAFLAFLALEGHQVVASHLVVALSLKSLQVQVAPRGRELQVPGSAAL